LVRAEDLPAQLADLGFEDVHALLQRLNCGLVHAHLEVSVVDAVMYGGQVPVHHGEASLLPHPLRCAEIPV
jgi:hypothetical protein